MRWVVDDEAISVGVSVLGQDPQMIRGGCIVFHPRLKRDLSPGEVKRDVCRLLFGKDSVEPVGIVLVAELGGDPVRGASDAGDADLIDQAIELLPDLARGAADMEVGGPSGGGAVVGGRVALCAIHVDPQQAVGRISDTHNVVP